MTNPQRIGTDLTEPKVLADIAAYGWHAMNIIEDDGYPPCTFTIGRYETWKHPELIVIGRSRATAHEILRSIVTEIEENRTPDRTDNPYLLLGMRCCFVDVNARYYEDYAGIARWFYRGKPFPMTQIIWPSTDGHYPWSQKASEPFKEWQPVLGKPPTTD